MRTARRGQNRPEGPVLRHSCRVSAPTSFSARRGIQKRRNQPKTASFDTVRVVQRVTSAVYSAVRCRGVHGHTRTYGGIHTTVHAPHGIPVHTYTTHPCTISGFLLTNQRLFAHQSGGFCSPIREVWHQSGRFGTNQ